MSEASPISSQPETPKGLFGLGDPVRRNVAILASAQALANTALSIVMVTTALVGFSLATDKSLATLPLGIHFLTMMATSAPASLLMGRVGRRAGLIFGSLLGTAGGLIQFAGVMQSDFTLLCIGSAPVGAFASFAAYYRFAAADIAPPAFRPRAISLCLAGGVVGAFFGPEIAKIGRDLFDPIMFAGCFLAVAALTFSTIFALVFVKIALPRQDGETRLHRPLSRIVGQPVAIAAIVSGAIGYGVMILIMTSTPLAMQSDGHSFDDSAFVIQWHALAMFGPSFFTGSIIARIGSRPTILTGIGLMIACLTIGLAGEGVWNYWLALLCLGLGWNFMFVGGSALLTACHEDHERAKVQALNDFLVSSTITIASFSSGFLFNGIGWTAVNLAVIPALLVAAIAIAQSYRPVRTVSA